VRFGGRVTISVRKIALSAWIPCLMVGPQTRRKSRESGARFFASVWGRLGPAPSGMSPVGNIQPLAVSNLVMRRIRLLARILLGLALGAVCAITVYAGHLTREASRVVHIVYEFSNRGTPTTIADLRQRLGNSLKQSAPCIENGCGYEVRLTNQWLGSLHLAPFSVLRASFWTTNGVLDVNTLDFWTINAEGRMFLSYVTFKYCDACDSVWLNPGESSRIPVTGTIDIGNRATEANKRIALALDVSCLTKLSGCTNPAQMFPTIWEQPSVEMVRCLIPNHDGTVE